MAWENGTMAEKGKSPDKVVRDITGGRIIK
jgi:hypothetical protein